MDDSYWASIRRDAKTVAQLPYSVRGGAIAREADEELRQLNVQIASLKRRIRLGSLKRKMGAQP